MKNNSNVVKSLVNKNFGENFWKLGNGTDDSAKSKDGSDYYYHDYIHEIKTNRYIEMEVRYLKHIDGKEEFIITVTSNDILQKNISGNGQIFYGTFGFKEARSYVQQLINN